MADKLTTPFGFSIFCDDIRHELQNKVSYIGVYTGALVVEEGFPANITRLGIATTLYIKATDEPKPAEFCAWLPSDPEGKPTVRESIPLESILANPPSTIGPDALIKMNFQILFTPIRLDSEGFLRLRLKYGDKEIKLGSLQVIKNDNSVLTEL